MATDERGRWKLDEGEPFNAGLNGWDPEFVRDSTLPGNDGCALVMLWLVGVVAVGLAVIGHSWVLAAFGAVAFLIAARWTIRRPR